VGTHEKSRRGASKDKPDQESDDHRGAEP
jgi:hypothetical protein